MTGMSTPGEGKAIEIQLQPKWPLDAASQAQAVNQVVCAWDQGGHDVMYLVLGHVPPPLWLTPGAAEEWASQNDSIDVQPRGSFIMSQKTAEDMWNILGRHLGKLQ